MSNITCKLYFHAFYPQMFDSVPNRKRKNLMTHLRMLKRMTRRSSNNLTGALPHTQPNKPTGLQPGMSINSFYNHKRTVIDVIFCINIT